MLAACRHILATLPALISGLCHLSMHDPCRDQMALKPTSDITHGTRLGGQLWPGLSI